MATCLLIKLKLRTISFPNLIEGKLTEIFKFNLDTGNRY